MLRVKTFPVFVSALAVVLGIVAAPVIPVDVSVATGITGLLLLGIYYFLPDYTSSDLWEKITDASVLLLSLSAGVLLAKVNTQSLQKQALPLNPPAEVRLIGEVISVPNVHSKYTSFRLQTFGFYLQDTFVPLSVPIQCKLDSGVVANFSQYDSLYATAFLYPLVTKHEKYQQYLKRNGIYYGAKIKTFAKGNKNASLFAYAGEIRTVLSRKMRSYIPDEAMAGITSAMFLGENDHLQESLTADYADAGVSHILAISGQHITMIFMLLNYLFIPLTYTKNGNRTKNILILCLLFFYMILCGAAASVVRSVSMFIIILIAKIFRKRYHILNLLGLAALLQMVWNPQIVYNLGFQLSYAAVCSIVIFYPFFEKQFMTGNKSLNVLFSWIGITLTAQIFTLPFILFNFGKFPTYFIVSNVILAPLAYLAVLTGFLLLIFCYIPGLNVLLGYLTFAFLWGMTFMARWVSDLPYAVIQSWDSPGILILMAILAGTFLLLLLPRWLRKKEEVRDYDGLRMWGLE
ncbi:MAG: ComEC/Rec2 family competence protein [Bacteroidia bacterium]|nr:ComEC/Rec2 family competence protein [Bacteroidia bacterium]